MKLFPNTRKFVRCWIDDTIPTAKKLAAKVKEELKKIYNEAREDYDKKKAAK